MSDKIKIGLVTDFRTYEDYFLKFKKKYGCEVLEIHILERDLDETFKKKLEKIKGFIRENGIKNLSFHSPDNMIQSILYDEENAMQYKERFFMMVDGLMGLSNDIDQDVIFIAHQGIKIPSAMIDSMSDAQLSDMKKSLLKKASESYNWLIQYTENSRLRVSLENSPPLCASDDRYHFYDLAFEDIDKRIGRNNFVFDICHAAMCIEYYKQDRMKLPALELLRKENHGIPKSLISVDNYVKIAAKNIKWIHIADVNGMLGDNEGLEIGAKDSVVDFKRFFETLKKYVHEPVCVLELVGSHKDYSIIDRSMEKLLKISDLIER